MNAQLQPPETKKKSVPCTDARSVAVLPSAVTARPSPPGHVVLFRSSAAGRQNLPNVANVNLNVHVHIR